MTQPIPLPQLHPGQQGVIVRVGGRGLLRRRYRELGLVKGETVRVERIAPLGDPVAYRIKGYTLSLRREEAQHIHVVPSA
ncbi:MAG: FeoA family protein [Anaerolineales bacterium]|nr:FeoA family protein [Anaerolineales bacterium]